VPPDLLRQQPGRSGAGRSPRCAAVDRPDGPPSLRLLTVINRSGGCPTTTLIVSDRGSRQRHAPATHREGYRVGVLEPPAVSPDDTLPKTSWDSRTSSGPKLASRASSEFTCSTTLIILAGAGVGGDPQLRQHPLRTAATVLRRPAVRTSPMARRAGPALRAGEEDARRRDQSDDDQVDVEMHSSRRSSARATRSIPLRSASSSDATGEGTRRPKCPTRSSGGRPVPARMSRCGSCIRAADNAKNTLVKNYLALAGAARNPSPDDVTDVRPCRAATTPSTRCVPDVASRTIHFHRHARRIRAGRTAPRRCCIASRQRRCAHLPTGWASSPGRNSESLLARDQQRQARRLHRRRAITSSCIRTENTHIDRCATQGSNAMGLPPRQ